MKRMYLRSRLDLLLVLVLVFLAIPQIADAQNLCRINDNEVQLQDLEIPMGYAAFGPLFDPGGITGDLELADDGVGLTTDGCEPIINDLQGKIALIDRGNCAYVNKVRHAQAAGATAVVLINDRFSFPYMQPPMWSPADDAGTDINIPSGMISREEGDVIRAGMDDGVSHKRIDHDVILQAWVDAVGTLSVDLQIAALTNFVGGIPAVDALRWPHALALYNKLDSAYVQYTLGNVQSATGMVEASITQTEALAASGHIEPRFAEIIVVVADRIKGRLVAN